MESLLHRRDLETAWHLPYRKPALGGAFKIYRTIGDVKPQFDWRFGGERLRAKPFAYGEAFFTPAELPRSAH